MHMRARLKYLTTGLTLLALWNGGCHSGSDARQARVDSATLTGIAPEADLTTEALRWADSVVASTPRERKAAMLLMPALYARTDVPTMNRIATLCHDLGVGGLLLLKGDLPSAAAIADTLRAFEADGLPPAFIAVDAENGLHMRFSDAPEFPWNRDLGNLSDDQLMYEFGRELARECRVVGINMVLGPVMDVVPQWIRGGVMRKRSLGSDPHKVANLAVAYARGIEDGNVLSVAKHFPGHGSSDSDSHKALGVIRSSRHRLDSIDLYPFRCYSDESLSAIMVGHLAVKALDTVKRPAVVSPVVMHDILRDEIGFRGLVITDALNMEGAMGVHAWEAIRAGADLVIAPTDTPRELRAMLEAMADGRLDPATVDDRCRRILFYKYLLSRADAHTTSHTRKSPAEIYRQIETQAPAMRDTLTGALRRAALHP
ncbi:MAG: hypothetical protein K2G75_04590 [Muribaculaceae bacterium]|nr:hypothetical protein [Muribaculaceae bacterium]